MAQVDDPDDNHIDRTLIADSGTNSWRLSEHICPVAVRPTKIKLELARGARYSLAGSTDRDCDWTDMRSGNNRAGKVWLWISLLSKTAFGESHFGQAGNCRSQCRLRE